MALFTDALAQEIVALIRERYRELGAALGEPAAPTGGSAAPLAEPLPEGNELRYNLNLLIAVANGRHMRTEALVIEVEQALKQLLELLLGSALYGKAAFPEGFWNTDIGILVSRARWWVSSDDLITISMAAALAFGENNQANRMRISRAIDNGSLDWVPDPSVSNPQQNRRVLRPQVERLRDLSRLPE